MCDLSRLWLALIQAFPDLPQRSVTSRQIRRTETTGRPSSRSSRALSRPPSLAGSWAGTTSTGPATPWSVLWLNWQFQIDPDSPSLSAQTFDRPLHLLCCKHWAWDFFICQNALNISFLLFVFLRTHNSVLIHFVSHATVIPVDPLWSTQAWYTGFL